MLMIHVSTMVETIAVSYLAGIATMIVIDIKRYVKHKHTSSEGK